jgi:phosphonate transport system substrate-binding protein
MMNRILAVVLCLFLAASASAQTRYSFGVLPQRSATLTAQYWNPILKYVGDRCGVTLELGMRKSAEEFSDAEARGEFDFVFSNHIFIPSHAAAAYRVIGRFAGEAIHGQIVVADTSAIRSLQELAGKEVGFPSRNAFVGYAAPMSALIQAGLAVTPVFGGNQEGVMAQLRTGVIPAAAVNSRVMKEYAARENFKYRALWTSEPYLDLPVAAHPRVPDPIAKAVADALIAMSSDAEGLKILQASAARVKQQAPWGFVPARDADYRNQREVYRVIWKKEAR